MALLPKRTLHAKLLESTHLLPVMYRHFTCKTFRFGAVFQALCAIVLVFSQSSEATGPQSQALLTPELVDRFVTVISLAEFQDREFDQTVAEIRELLPQSPLREQSYELMKSALLGAGLKAEAEIVLRTGLKTFPESRLLRIYLADVLSGTGRSSEALGILVEASRISRPRAMDASTDRQQRAVILQRIGSIHSGLAHLDEAFSAYRQAVEIAPESTEARVQLGKAYFDSNRLEEAQSEFEDAVRGSPNNKEAHLGLSATYLARGIWEKAAASAERAVKLDSSNSRALYLLGTALIRMNRREEGQSRLREFAKIEASIQEVERRYVDIDAISISAIRALREGNGDAATEKLIQGIASYPDSSRLHMNLALALSRTGKHQMAVETLESMLRRTNSGRFLIHKHLADEYKTLGDAEASGRHRQVYLNTMEAEFIMLARR
ncbi:MAG TPA: tetratricopeptide repeat protein [Terriglobia bacterium]|nr:tetratricopeptide repeat protein [Terriglobia bacterium]